MLARGGVRKGHGASEGSYSAVPAAAGGAGWVGGVGATARPATPDRWVEPDPLPVELALQHRELVPEGEDFSVRSEEHTSELQSLRHLVCRLLLEKKNRLEHVKSK